MCYIFRISEIQFPALFFLILCYFSSNVVAQTDSQIKEHIDSLSSIGFIELTANPQDYEDVLLDAIQLADSINYTLGLANLNTRISVVYSYLGKADLKTESQLNSIRFYIEIDSLKKAGNQFAELGWGFRRTDPEKAEEYMKQGLAILSDFPGSIEQANAFNNYGLVKLTLEQPDSAIFFINKSMEIKENAKDTLGIAYSLSYLANVYMETGEFRKAIEQLDLAISTREPINDISGISIDLVNAGMSYMTLGELDKALEYLKRSLSLAYRTSNTGLAGFAFNTISNTFEDRGQFDSALIYYKQFISFTDSINSVETQERIAELEIQFQTEEKEKEIAQKTAALSIEQLRVKRRNWVAGIFGSLFLSASLISLLIVRQQRIKRDNLIRENELKVQLANAEMENKILEERERISRELHDNVGSQISNLITGIEISNLHVKKNQQDEALSLLNNLDNDARGAMTDLRETIWLLDKDKVEFGIFLEHLNGYFNRQKRYLKDLKIKVESNVDPNFILNPTRSLNLTRIIQEALNNTNKYAEASLFKIECVQSNNEISITLSDNGKGMDTVAGIGSGNGLINMQERAKLMEAEILIESKARKGTTISLVFS